MTTWLAGMKITADRLNDYTATSTTTTGLTAASNFTVSSFSGKKVSGITYVEMFLTRTTSTVAETATNTGNIADTALCTLPSGWRPPELINAIYGNGSVDGECTIDTSGVVTLRSISGNAGISFSPATNVRVTALWISENS